MSELPRSSSPSRRALVITVAASLAFSLASPASDARAVVDLSTWVTDGFASALLVDGNTLYVGGRFRRIGPVTGSGVTISTSTLQLQPGAPRVVGTVSAVAADGAGGWYLGGSFSYVGGVARQNLAHVTSAGTVDTWSPGTDGEVLAIAVTPADVIIGGVFTTVNGLARPRLARISRSSGQPAAWTPSPNDRVSALASDGTTLYAAGWFSQIAATPRAGLAAFTHANDALTSWDPGATAFSPQVQVNGLALGNGYIYVGGNFTQIGGQPRFFAAALRPGNGTATGWNVPGGDNAVNRLLPIGDRVILGGSFNGIANAGFRGLAAVDTATGALFPNWSPQPSPPTGSVVQIHALERLGNRVAVGGSFAGISGTQTFSFTVLDTAAGAAASVTPMPTREVRALAGQGGELFVGGAFACLGATLRSNLAAFDVASGAPLGWAPNATQAENFGGQGSVTALTADSTRIFAVVTFNDIMSGLPRSQVRAFARAGGGTTWSVDCDQVVNAIAYRGGRVHAGGGFSFLGGARTNLAALDAANGSLQAWNPGASHPVRVLLALDAALAVGGDFTTVGGQPRTRLAQLDYGSGAPTAWDPGADGSVQAMARSGSTLYVGGSFATAGGQSRSRVAALDLGSNAALPWNPGASATVQALATNGASVFAGGSFTTFGGQPAARFAAVTAAGGTPLPWGASANNTVNALALANSHVFLAGLFSAVDTEPTSALASVFDPALLGVPPSAKPPGVRLAVGPSPLRGTGQIGFSLDREANVRLRVHDVTGRVARTLLAGERRPAGPHRVEFTAAGLAPGVYHVVLDLDGERGSARVIVLP